MAPGAEGLLSLRPDDFVFYVGGYPRHFTVSLAWRGAALHSHPRKSCSMSGCPLSALPGLCPGGKSPDCALCLQPPEPLRLPGYLGCIEMDALNEEVLSLYNFEETFQLDTAVDRPCARYVQPGLGPRRALADSWLTALTSDLQLQVDRGPVAHGRLLPGRLRLRAHQRGESDGHDQALRAGAAARVLPRHRLLHAAPGTQAARPRHAPPPPAPGPVLTCPSPQEQFLCLAVRRGSLLLLYDFGAGLMEATLNTGVNASLLNMTTASKAVRLGSGEGSGAPGGPMGHTAHPQAGARGRLADPGVPAGGEPRPCQPRAGARGEEQRVQRGPQQHAGAGQRLLPRGRAARPAAPKVSLGAAGRERAGTWAAAAAGPDAGRLQPAAALPLRRLGPRMRQGHQGSGQVRGSQEAEHDGRQLGLHCRPAGEPWPALASSPMPGLCRGGPSRSPSSRWDGP